MNKNIASVIACVVVLFLYALAGALMGWHNAGGLMGHVRDIRCG